MPNVDYVLCKVRKKVSKKATIKVKSSLSDKTM